MKSEHKQEIAELILKKFKDYGIVLIDDEQNDLFNIQKVNEEYAEEKIIQAIEEWEEDEVGK